LKPLKVSRERASAAQRGTHCSTAVPEMFLHQQAKAGTVGALSVLGMGCAGLGMRCDTLHTPTVHGPARQTPPAPHKTLHSQLYQVRGKRRRAPAAGHGAVQASGLRHAASGEHHREEILACGLWSGGMCHSSSQASAGKQGTWHPPLLTVARDSATTGRGAGCL
jgi:hypothetical protein